MQELPPAMAGVGSAVNDTTRNMGSVLGVAAFGSITASVFASQTAHLAHGAIGSVGAAAEVAHHVGGAYGAALRHTAAGAFVTGADHAVIAGAIATVAGLLVAFATLHARRRTPAQALAPAAAALPAKTPAPAAEVLVPTGAARG
jgi:hypothetical protein